MKTQVLRLAALAVALAAGTAGATQIPGSGIGDTNHETVAGTTAARAQPAKPGSATPAKAPAPAASGARR